MARTVKDVARDQQRQARAATSLGGRACAEVRRCHSFHGAERDMDQRAMAIGLDRRRAGQKASETAAVRTSAAASVCQRSDAREYRRASAGKAASVGAVLHHAAAD